MGAKNGNVAAKCEACATGKFNAKDDASTTCADHNKCASTSVKTAGDTTKDAVCNAATGVVTKCAAGKKFVAKNGNVAAKCDVCATGKFNAKDDNSASCADHNKCTDSSVKTKGDTTKDAVCNVVTKCAAGKKKFAKNGNVAAKCEVCANGKFNAKADNSASCTAHNKCASTSVKTKGDTTKDAVCKEESMSNSDTISVALP